MKRANLARSALALLGTALILSGCGGNEEDGIDGVAAEIDFLYPTDNPGFDTSMPDALGEAFTAESGIDVRLLDAATSYQEVDQQLRSDLVSGNVPDVVAVGLNSVRTYVDAGVAQPLDDLMADDSDFDINSLYEQYRHIGEFDGQTYALPYTVTVLAMYYNADIFEAAGLDPDKPPTTSSELRDAARQIVESGAAKTGVMSRHDSTSMWPMQSFVFSNGGSFVNEEESSVTFTDDTVVNVVDYWADMQTNGLAETTNSDHMASSFAREDVGIILNSASSLEATKNSSDFELRTASIPVPDDGELRTAALGTALIVTATDEASQRAAWQAIGELVSPEGSTAITQATGYLPVSRTAVESPELLGDFLAEDPLREPIFAQADHAVATYQFPGNNAVEMWDIFANSVIEATRGDKSSEDALGEAERAANRLLP